MCRNVFCSKTLPHPWKCLIFYDTRKRGTINGLTNRFEHFCLFLRRYGVIRNNSEIPKNGTLVDFTPVYGIKMKSVLDGTQTQETPFHVLSLSNSTKKSSQFQYLHRNQVNFDHPHLNQVNLAFPHKNEVNFETHTKTKSFSALAQKPSQVRYPH